MATNNRGGTRHNNRARSGRSSNSTARKQYSGIANTARENPFATAAAVGGAVAAGVFLWSRRNQISDQLSNLAQQISEGREATEYGSFSAKSGSQARGSGRSQVEIAEEALTLKELGTTT